MRRVVRYFVIYPGFPWHDEKVAEGGEPTFPIVTSQPAFPHHIHHMNTDFHIRATNGMGKEIHEFLDQFFEQYRIDHRVVLHHKIGVKLVGMKFGAGGIPIAEKHIRDDWNGDIPSGPDDLSFYRESWACDAKRFSEAYEKAKQIEKGMQGRREE